MLAVPEFQRCIRLQSSRDVLSCEEEDTCIGYRVLEMPTPAEPPIATSWALANSLANSSPRFFLGFFLKKRGMSYAQTAIKECTQL